MQRERTLSFEPLERREMLASSADVSASLTAGDIGGALRQTLMMKEEGVWTDEELRAVTAAAVQDPDFATLATLEASWRKEGADVVTATAREDFVRGQRDGASLELGNDLATLETDKQSLLQSQQALSKLTQQERQLTQSIATLNATLSSLTTEEASLRQQLPAAQKNVTTAQSTLATVTQQHATAEANELTWTKNVASVQQSIEKTKLALQTKPKNQTLLRQLAQQEKTLTLYQSSLLQSQKTHLQYDQLLVQAQQTLASAQQTLQTLQTRLSTIPGERTRTTAERDAASTSLAGTVTQKEMTSQEITQAQGAVDALMAEVSSDETLLASEESALADAVALRTAEVGEQTEVTAAVRQAIAAVLENPPQLESSSLTETPTLAQGRAEGTGWRVDLTTLGGSAIFLPSQGRSTFAASATATPDGKLQLAGSATALDLHQSGKRVYEVRATVAADGTGVTITVDAYRGEERVTTQTVSAGAQFQLSDEGGLTSLVLVPSNPSAQLFVSDLQISAWKDETPPPADAPAAKNNRTVALNGTPAWEHAPFFYPTILQQNGIQGYSGGQTIYAGGAFFPGSENKTQQYTLHEVRSSGGAWLRSLFYANENGVFRLPEDQWTSIGSCGAVTYPGAPRLLIYEVVGTGTFDLAPNKRMADTFSEVLPAQGMDLQADVLVTLQGPRAEGWGDVPASVPSQNFHCGAGGTTSILAEIRNDGQTGGAVTVRVHVGPTGSVADPVAKEFAGTLNPLAKKALAVNVTLPADNSFVTFEVVGPNGQSAVYFRRVHLPQPHELSPEERAAAMSSRRIDSLREKIQQTLESSSSPIVVAWWSATQANAGATSEARRRLLEEMVAEGVTQRETATDPEAITAETRRLLIAWNVDAGGFEWHASADDSNPSNTPLDERYDRTATLHEAQRWYDPNRPLPDPSMATAVRTDSAIGRLFLGLVQQMQAAKDANDTFAMRVLAEKVELLTDIPTEKTLSYAQANGLRELFTIGNFGSIFLNQSSSSPAPTQILSAVPNATTYTSESIRIRFDIIPNGKELAYVQVYRADQAPPSSSTSSAFDSNVLAVACDQYFVEVPLSKFTANQSEQVTFLVRAYFRDGTTCDKTVDPVVVKWDGAIPGDYSTLPNTTENADRRQLENAILGLVAQHFPLEGNASDWRWVIASDYHVGADINATDLNWGSGNADRDKEIKAMADGTIEKIGLDFGSVRIQHDTTVNGQVKHWFSEILHMPIYATNRSTPDGKLIYEVRKADGTATFELFEGMSLHAGQSYGLVAGRGLVNGQQNDSAFSAHAHQEIEVDGRSVDLRTLMKTWGIANVVASDLGGKGEMQVRWDDQAQCWMNDSYGLAFDRSAQDGTARAAGYWIAWSADASKRSRVTWAYNKLTNESFWVRVDSNGNILESSPGKIWRWINNEWMEVPYSA